MPRIKFSYIKEPFEPNPSTGQMTHLNSVPIAEFDGLSPSVLGLGDISREGKYVQTIAAVFDLQGFTSFCNQPDSHLVLPEFLEKYLKWLFDTLKTRFSERRGKDRVRIWGSIPFFAKFMGDGVLFLWDVDEAGRSGGIRSTIVTCCEITEDYRSQFWPEIRKHVSNAPRLLRCGVARGQVISVGDDGDYVGSCINIASRLQKMPGLTFAISRRGLDATQAYRRAFWDSLVVKRVALRGIGNDELIYVLAHEFDALSPEDRENYQDVGGA